MQEKNLKEPKSKEMIDSKAWSFAVNAHKGQLDDNGRDFFLAHPAVVATLLTLVAPADTNLSAAGLLHDVIEDTKYTYEDLKREFGEDIADLVHEVTYEGQKDAYGYYFPRLRTRRGVMLKLADRLSNLSRMESWSQERRDHYVKKTITGINIKAPSNKSWDAGSRRIK